MKWQGGILLLLISINGSFCFIKWLFNEEGSDPDSAEATKPVSFEMKTVDETFLTEADSGLSELDFCHHRVVSELHSTCSDLNEEGLAKLSVQLLNCQLESEDRDSYACTTDMTIKECTKSMDPIMWNSYQIVSNRARAICYSVRQQHFRMKTEYTVNKLVHNTHEQIQAMHRIQTSQEKINELTGTTMEQLQSSQRSLVQQHDDMQASASQMQRFIAGNLQALTQEKALIASGNKALHEATERIQDKLDNTLENMKKQEEMQKENQQVLLDDLAQIQGKAKKVFDKIDDSSKNILHYHEETSRQYETTLDNLSKVNETVNSVLNTIYQLQLAFDKRMKWISGMLGEADNKVEIIAAVASHILYFIIIGITAAMLNTPVLSRYVVLGLIPLNAWAQVRGTPHFSFNALTFLITAVVIVNWIMVKVFGLCRNRGSKSAPGCPGGGTENYTDKMVVRPMDPQVPVSPEELRKVISVLQTYANSLNGSLSEVNNTSKILRYNDSFHNKSKINDSFSKTKEESSRKTSLDSAVTRTEFDSEEEEIDKEEDEDKENREESKRSKENKEGIFENTPEDEEFRNYSVLKGSIKNRADQIKRQLMRSPGSPLGRSYDEFLDNSRLSRSSTPNKSPSRSRNSRSRTPSFSRPLCAASTKTGQPCRLMQKDDSPFCHRHQGNNTSILE